MNNIIKETENLLNALDIETEECSDIHKIIEYLSKNKDKNILLNLPFNNYINNEYYEYIPVVVQKLTKDKLFFIRTFKTTEFKLNNNEFEKKETQEDSINIDELIELSNKTPIIAFLEI